MISHNVQTNADSSESGTTGNVCQISPQSSIVFRLKNFCLISDVRVLEEQNLMSLKLVLEELRKIPIKVQFCLFMCVIQK